ncbi:hypothetical protein [uncultured Endozoicomonas sp.]|nr:hypothetical protein [uncultured Endozoicomonas sp.]
MKQVAKANLSGAPQARPVERSGTNLILLLGYTTEQDISLLHL